MFEVIYMKAEFEPWWMFEEWEEMVLSRRSFENIVEAKKHLENMLQNFRTKYDNEAMKKECFYAFWTEDEKSFCEACDNDLQIYHGIILLFEGKPYQL